MHNIPQHPNCGCWEDWNWVRRLQDPLPRASIENPNTCDVFFFFFPGGREIYEFEKTYGSKGKTSAGRRGCLCDICSHYMMHEGIRHTQTDERIRTCASLDFLHPHLRRFRGERAVKENRQYCVGLYGSWKGHTCIKTYIHQSSPAHTCINIFPDPISLVW